jgi:alkyl sulfatase BDS1-like metallo-beta-lactamase superfamily hydrolase
MMSGPFPRRITCACTVLKGGKIIICEKSFCMQCMPRSFAASTTYDSGSGCSPIAAATPHAPSTHSTARRLQADALEQLGYRSESGPWRDFYLTGAQELRNGTPNPLGVVGGTVNADMVASMTPGMLFTWLGVRINGPEAAALGYISLDVEVATVADAPERWHMGLSNGALFATPGITAAGAETPGAAASESVTPAPDAHVACSRDTLAALVLDPTPSTLDGLIDNGSLHIDGDRRAVDQLVSVCDAFSVWFPLIEPQRRDPAG